MAECVRVDLAEYKDLEARVDALRAAHLTLLKYVRTSPNLNLTKLMLVIPDSG